MYKNTDTFLLSLKIKDDSLFYFVTGTILNNCFQFKMSLGFTIHRRTVEKSENLLESVINCG